LLKKCRIKKVYYTNDDGTVESVRVNSLISDFRTRGTEVIEEYGIPGLTTDVTYVKLVEKKLSE
jgi:hypothetical protein